MNANVTEAIKALKEKPLKATSIERVILLSKAHKNRLEEENQPKRFGLTIKDFLSEVSVTLKEDDLIAGRCVDKELSLEEEKTFGEFLKDADNPYRKTVFAFGHASLDWQYLVSVGLTGIIRDIRQKKQQVTDKKQIDFLSGAESLLEGIIIYLLRYAREALKQGKEELSEVLTQIAYNPPKTFYQALQLVYVVAFINCAYISFNPTLCLGRLDYVLSPFYEKDKKDGVIDEDFARELITDFYCKNNLTMGRGEHQLGTAEDSTTFDRILNFDSPQYLLLGGVDEGGEVFASELTYLFASCIVPEFKNPVIVVRYAKGLYEKHPALWRTFCAKALKNSSLMVYNDDTVKQSLLRIGLPKEDVFKSEHFGCNWTSIGAESQVLFMGPTAKKLSNGFLQKENPQYNYSHEDVRFGCEGGFPETFVKVLDRLVKEDAQVNNVDDILEEFKKDFQKEISLRVERELEEVRYRRRYTSTVLTYGDCFTKRSIQNADGCCGKGRKYLTSAQSIMGFATVADSLTAIEKLVFIDKVVTLKELLEVVKDNFESSKKLYALCKKTPKFGCGDNLADKNAVKVANLIADVIYKEGSKYVKTDGYFLMSSLQCDNWHLRLGKNFGATFDGRLKGESFSQNSNPSNGSRKNGITGLMQSLLKLPFYKFSSGALNLDVEPNSFCGDDGETNFASLTAEYFENGGMHMQVNCVDKKTLIKAQQDPNNYRDLRVRITGYSGIFVDCGKKIQNDIIERME